MTEYIHLTLMYNTDHILTVLPIKHLVYQDGEPTTPQKLSTGTRYSVSNLRVLLCPCVVKNTNVHIEKNMLNMRHQSQKTFAVSSLESHNTKKVT